MSFFGLYDDENEFSPMSDSFIFTRFGQPPHLLFNNAQQQSAAAAVVRAQQQQQQQQHQQQQQAQAAHIQQQQQTIIGLLGRGGGGVSAAGLGGVVGRAGVGVGSNSGMAIDARGPVTTPPERSMIRDVWAQDLEKEMAVLRDLVETYQYVAMVGYSLALLWEHWAMGVLANGRVRILNSPE